MIYLNLYPFIKSNVFESMALDELLLEEGETHGFFRFYLMEPSLTLGYFQKVEKVDFTLPWTRRITGGGVVEHGNDIIFSVSAPIDCFGGIRSIYQQIHQTLKEGISWLIPDIQEVFQRKPERAKSFSYCFQNPVSFDLSRNGKKVVGGAICRKASRFLYQGSLQLPELDDSLNYEKFVKHTGEKMKKLFKFKIVEGRIPETIMQKAFSLSLTKYKNIAWKQKF